MDMGYLLDEVGGSRACAAVTGLALDSRQARPGDAFFALPGVRGHGLSHAGQAVRHGATCVVYDPAAGGAELARTLDGRVPMHAVESLREKLGLIAARFYGYPSQHMDIIGVTGTNGKTSCTHFIAAALGAEQPAAVVGTLGWGRPGHLQPTLNTTPDPIHLQAALAELDAQRFRAVAVEVSSHALEQGRINGVRFKGAVFTNISRDHLDYHGDMASYLGAKLRLFRRPELEFVVCNLDDPGADAVRAAVSGDVAWWGFSRAEPTVPNNRILHAANIRQDDAGLVFEVRCAGEHAMVRAPVVGAFNVDNLLATLTTLCALGWSLDRAARRMALVRAVPGRMERFGAGLPAPAVVVDYAHTPHALESALRALRTQTGGHLSVVFGCGGERDRGKRASMGEVASRLADRVVLTDDNPRSEDGAVIVDDILAGCPDPGRVTVLRDRRQAIEWAIRTSSPGDLVLVAGKGHETTQEVAGVKQPFDDRQVVRRALMSSGVDACV